VVFWGISTINGSPRATFSALFVAEIVTATILTKHRGGQDGLRTWSLNRITWVALR
jgi:hypothetical protein